MVKLLILISLALLTGCDRKPWALSMERKVTQGDAVYLMPGQSNLANMPTEFISQPLAGLGIGGNVFNCAKGGSRLSEWQRGQPFYDEAVKQAKANGGRLAGVFFWQGETEGVWGPEYEASIWAREFTRFVRNLREDTGIPKLRVVCMQIGILDSYPYAATVKAQQASVYIENVIMTTTAGYTPDADGHHFKNSYKELGERMAQAMYDGYI